MKKSLIYTAAISLMLVFTLSSCEDAFGDFLDKQPSNELTEDEVFEDWELMEQFWFDTYNFLLHGACRINGDSWLDAATDLAETSIGTSATRTSFNVGSYYNDTAADELTSPWESRYRAIRKCNMLLEKIDSVPQPTDVSDELYATNKSIYKAEARVFRAYFYWELFLRYGAVPLVLEVLDPDGDLLSGYTERPTVKEYVVDFILSELQECESALYDYSTAWGTAYAGRLSQPMARALYCRIMLYMASPRFSADSGITWQQAADAQKGFIDDYGGYFSIMGSDGSGDYDPLSDAMPYKNAWYYTTYGTGNTETIFFRNDPVIYWASISVDSPIGEGGEGGCCPSQNLIDMYDMIDGQSPFTSYDETGAPEYDANGNPTVNPWSGYDDQTMWENRDNRLYATVLYHGTEWGDKTDNIINVISGMRDNPTGTANVTPTGYYLRKYIPQNILLNDHSGSDYRLWKIIGYAEILLNYVEALNEISYEQNKVTICDYLNTIRTRAGITGDLADRLYDDLTDQETMRNFIHKERTIELAFEEHRWWDCKRWNCAVEAFSRPIYGVDVTEDSNGNTVITRKTAQTRTFEEKMYLYPIPETEVWKTNIEDNPGW